MAWYWWALIAVVVVLALNMLTGVLAARRQDRFVAEHRGQLMTQIHHSRWTPDDKGCRFYESSRDGSIRWRYDEGVEPDFENGMMAELELTALELRLGRPLSFPRNEAAARELNARRDPGPGGLPG